MRGMKSMPECCSPAAVESRFQCQSAGRARVARGEAVGPNSASLTRINFFIFSVFYLSVLRLVRGGTGSGVSKSPRIVSKSESSFFNSSFSSSGLNCLGFRALSTSTDSIFKGIAHSERFSGNSSNSFFFTAHWNLLGDDSQLKPNERPMLIVPSKEMRVWWRLGGRSAKAATDYQAASRTDFTSGKWNGL